MSHFVQSLSTEIVKILPTAEALYKDLHQNPELSFQETRTAGIVAGKLREAGFEVAEKVGRTGVVGILRNGEGPTVAMRADMDALPIKEATGLPYASTCEGSNPKGETVPVSHACGHDMHTTWLLGSAAVLAASRDAWKGTLMVLFQPAEEFGAGSQAMLDDGLTERFPRPEVVLGQHLLNYRAGSIGLRAGQLCAAADSYKVTFFGKGGHGGLPQNAIDPILMAANAIVRLQSIVAREVSPQVSTVITIGEFHAGTAENIIPAEAIITLNVRNTDAATRELVLASIRRICNAEAAASKAPKEPEFELISQFPLTLNDAGVVKKVAEAFRGPFGDRVFEMQPLGGSEDFSRFGTAWEAPYAFWFIGGTALDVYDRALAEGTIAQLPGPHSPFWAPALEPTLRTGIEGSLAALGAWLAENAQG